MSEICGSVRLGRVRYLRIAPTLGPAVSGMRERGAVGKLTRLGAQAIGGERVTLRRVRIEAREEQKTAQNEERQGLRASAGA